MCVASDSCRSRIQDQLRVACGEISSKPRCLLDLLAKQRLPANSVIKSDQLGAASRAQHLEVPR